MGHDQGECIDIVTNTACGLAISLDEAEIAFVADVLGQLQESADDNADSFEDLIEDATNELSFDPSSKNEEHKYLLQAEQRLAGMVQYALIDQSKEYRGLADLLRKAGREVTTDRIRDYHLIILEHYGLTDLAELFKNAMDDIGHAMQRREYKGALARRDVIQKYFITSLAEEVELILMDTQNYCENLEQVKGEVIEETLRLARKAKNPEERKWLADSALKHAEFNILEHYELDVERKDYSWVKETVMDIFKNGSA